jgi:hypothetical protein
LPNVLQLPFYFPNFIKRRVKKKIFCHVLQKPVKVIGTFGMPSEKFGYAVRKQDTKLLDTLNKGCVAHIAL